MAQNSIQKWGKYRIFRHSTPSLPHFYSPRRCGKRSAPQAGARADLPQQCALKKGTGICTGDGGGICAMPMARGTSWGIFSFEKRKSPMPPKEKRGGIPKSCPPSRHYDWRSFQGSHRNPVPVVAVGKGRAASRVSFRL